MWRQVLNAAVKMMQAFDVYVWLLRWLGHSDPGLDYYLFITASRSYLLCKTVKGLRLLVLTILGILANPLLPTKQKIDPSRKATCLVRIVTTFVVELF